MKSNSLDTDKVNQNIRDDIQRYKPKHKFGQNFIFDEVILSNIVKACMIQKDEAILEIGSGPGTLTHELLLSGNQVVGIEIDDDLIGIARKNLVSHNNLTIIHEDILDLDISRLFKEGILNTSYIAVGNIPYYITQPILQKLLRLSPHPKKIILMTQKELANRIVGGKNKESFLSLLVQIYGKATKVFDLPANAFWPMPKVNSSLISITPNSDKLYSNEFIVELLSVIKIGFSAPRKQIHNVFKLSLDIEHTKLNNLLSDAGVNPTLRAQHIDLLTWIELTKLFKIKLPKILDELRKAYL
ncbi:MAG: 16S rRNA (adenine(1518)-N(6)/adenine(1519)-N(6))-dimethyltransferase RsmA [Dehalococcoidia bacterium]|nr:16S rRNA (adenine(1518)-N(6)/adenine(1519)-N(6))-dimethyltransferase RsmA [Dehalococcoidia bacterium]